jgi:L-malate glycosyltransferase
LIDPSSSLTGALVCARNEARLLKGKAVLTLVIPCDAAILADDSGHFRRVFRVPFKHLRKTVHSFIVYLPALLRSSWIISSLLKNDRIECLQINDFYLMHGVVCRLFGYRGRLVTWVRIDPRRFGWFPGRVWLFFAVRASDRIVAVSEFIATILRPSVDAAVLYDTSALLATVSVDQATSEAPRARRFVFIGNYMPGKGQGEAVRAFARLAERMAEFDLHFYGGDLGLEKNRAFRETLEREVVALGLRHRIVFHGFVDDPSPVLLGAHAALNFSYSESFSMTCLEAGACGTPVIATRCGGPEEIVVHGKTGLLVPVGDIDAMADAMLALASDEALARRMGANAALHTREQFSAERFVAGLREVLQV